MSKSRTLIPSAIRRLGIPALAAFGGAVAAYGQATLAANSPFMPSAAAAAAGAASSEAFELAGSSVQGSDVSVCIFEREAKRSQWIPVGGITDGIHVVSYDARNDKAVVTIGGAFRELTMRKATIASSGPSLGPRAAPVMVAPLAGPMASAPPVPATSEQREQQEARMLVSDLLEIGVQQRKAYQEARQRAASATPAQPTN